MRTIAALAVALALAGMAGAADRILYTKVSASQTVTNSTLTASTKHVLLINDGPSSVYYELFSAAETPTDATTASKELKSGESITFSFSASFDRPGPGGDWYKTLSTICATGQTATVRAISK